MVTQTSLTGLYLLTRLLLTWLLIWILSLWINYLGPFMLMRLLTPAPQNAVAVVNSDLRGLYMLMLLLTWLLTWLLQVNHMGPCVMTRPLTPTCRRL